MIDRDTLIAMAEKHAICTSSQHKEFLHDELIAFVGEISQMAAEGEREACALINAEKSERLGQEAEEALKEGDRDTCTSNRAAAHLLSVCAARIRARGTGGEG